MNLKINPKGKKEDTVISQDLFAGKRNKSQNIISNASEIYKKEVYLYNKLAKLVEKLRKKFAKN
jgi:hypothetical protein